jgi:TrmH family RNA methyltransferase
LQAKQLNLTNFILSKQKINGIKQLQQKKFREQQALFIIEGTKSVLEAITSSIKMEEIFATQAWLEEQNQHLKISNIKLVNYADIERMSSLKKPQPVLAVAHIPQRNISEIDINQPLLVLDGIRDPGNMGTIIRSADWFGVRQILASEDSVEWSNPKVIQASMGSFCRVKIFYSSLVDYLKTRSDTCVLGTYMKGNSLIYTQFRYNTIIIIGNEGRGISAELSACVNERIAIPTPVDNNTESLNASIAAAIVLYQYSISCTQKTID